MKHINSLSGVVGQGQKIIMKLLLIQVVKKQNKKLTTGFWSSASWISASCSWSSLIVWKSASYPVVESEIDKKCVLKNSANMEVYIQKKMKEKYLVHSTFFVKKGSSKKRLPCRFQILHTLIKVAERLLFSLICIQTRPVLLLCARYLLSSLSHCSILLVLFSFIKNSKLISDAKFWFFPIDIGILKLSTKNKLK